MSRVITLVATPIYQNSLSSVDSWRDVILQTFANDGWQIVSLNISFSVFSGGYITIVANIDDNYNDAFVVQRANQILESIESPYFGQVFSNANFKILSDTNSAITTNTDTTRDLQDSDKLFSTSTIMIGLAVLVFFLLKK